MKILRDFKEFRTSLAPSSVSQPGCVVFSVLRKPRGDKRLLGKSCPCESDRAPRLLVIVPQNTGQLATEVYLAECSPPEHGSTHEQLCVHLKSEGEEGGRAGCWGERLSVEVGSRLSVVNQGDFPRPSHAALRGSVYCVSVCAGIYVCMYVDYVWRSEDNQCPSAPSTLFEAWSLA